MVKTKGQSALSSVEFGGRVQILHARYQGRAFTPHWHEEFAVGLIVDGVESFDYRGSTHSAAVQQVMLLNAGEIHTGEAYDERGFAFRMLYIPRSTFEEVAQASCRRSTLHFRNAVMDDHAISKALRELHLKLPMEPGTLGKESLLAEALVVVLERAGSWKPAPEPKAVPAAMGSARDLLHAHLCEDISLDSLSKQAGVSKYHFLRSFRRQFGLPPHSYQLQQRIFLAKRVIERGTALAGVAAQCGFSDQSHLNRVFRSLVGVTPGVYAQQFHPRHTGD